MAGELKKLAMSQCGSFSWYNVRLRKFYSLNEAAELSEKQIIFFSG
jgi:hypothetical protein